VIVAGSGVNELSLARWIQILSGVMWAGLLFYVVVAQIPALGAAAGDRGSPGGAGITKCVAPMSPRDGRCWPPAGGFIYLDRGAR
jgi:hypothetical protein